VDFNVPERFDVTYRGPDGKDHRPIMIHRALMGSLERFFGVLIEHYAGAFPTWLAPKQVAIVTVADRHVPYATELADRLEREGFRVERMFDNEKVGYKVRLATVRKIPYSVIIGDREVEGKRFSVRHRSGKQTGPYTEDEFIERLAEEVRTKRNTFEV
jgi:threonyl-tRNA synthetase